MDKVYLKLQFEKHKDLFLQIKHASNVNKILNVRSDDQLNVLLKFLHLIGDGHIPILSKHQQVVTKAKRERKLMEAGSPMYFKTLMKKDRLQKLKALKHFKSLLSLFMESFFLKMDPSVLSQIGRNSYYVPIAFHSSNAFYLHPAITSHVLLYQPILLLLVIYTFPKMN